MRQKKLLHPGILVETQLLKPISFGSQRMVRAKILLGPSLNMLVSWLTVFQLYQSLQKTPVTSIKNFSSATITTEWLHFSIFFLLNNCSWHSPKYYGHHLRHFSGGVPSPRQTYNLSFIKDRGPFCRLFPSVIIHACCRVEQLQYWLPVRLNATIATIFFFFRNVMRKPVEIAYIILYLHLPGCNKLFGRVVYIYIHYKTEGRLTTYNLSWSYMKRRYQH